MILHGAKKSKLEGIIKYYVRATGNTYDEFINAVQKYDGKIIPDMVYAEWLAIKLYAELATSEITLEDCIENKDTIRASVSAKDSREEGEFYTPEVWANDGREYLKKLLGDKWGEAYIWDASCGSGNLLRNSGYPQDKIFMSSLLPTDVELIKQTMPDVTSFQLDFLNGIDYDEYNTGFSSLLPDSLVEVLKSNKPIVFFMNPPYKVGKSTRTEVGVYMGDRGMAKCALDLFHQFMYRLLMIKRFYGLTDVYAGIYGPVTMFHSEMLTLLFNDFKSEFKFYDGMCFDAKEFANTSESVGWMIGYTVWETRKEPAVGHERLVLTAKEVSSVTGELYEVGSRLVTTVESTMHSWIRANDVLRRDHSYPIATTFMTPTGDFAKTPEDFFGYIMSAGYAIRATRRTAVLSLPTPEDIVITSENFERCMASFVARRCYETDSNPFDNCQYYSEPLVNQEGYTQWLADALVVFLFDNSAHHCSYRNMEVSGHYVTRANRMFPFTKEQVAGVITDQNIIDDLNMHNAENQFILSYIESVKHLWSPEAIEFFEYGKAMLLKSLQGTARQEANYEWWTQAWDAGLLQIRSVQGVFTPEEDARYSTLLHALKNRLYAGVFKYGFMMQTAFEVADEVSEIASIEEGVILSDSNAQSVIEEDFSFLKGV